jgi:hypothetical protein
VRTILVLGWIFGFFGALMAKTRMTKTRGKMISQNLPNEASKQRYVICFE